MIKIKKEGIKLNADDLGFIQEQRNTIKDILTNKSSKKLLVVGPCSFYQQEELYEYAEKLKKLQDKVSDVFHVVMRVYPEKSRTSLGWLGVLNQPLGTLEYDLERGIHRVYETFTWLVQKRIAIASEMVNPLLFQSYLDFIALGSIGARHTRSNIHRDEASGHDVPFLIKNTLCGSIDAAIDAIEVVSSSRAIIRNDQNTLCFDQTRGNPYSILTLRGSQNGANVDQVEKAIEKLVARKLHPGVVIDCSHGNAQGDPSNQLKVFHSVLNSITDDIKGFMLESFLFSGHSSLGHHKHGISLTDPCLGWNETEEGILFAYEALKK